MRVGECVRESECVSVREREIERERERERYIYIMIYLINSCLISSYLPRRACKRETTVE